MDDIDTNIDNYSVDELLDMMNLQDPSLYQIKDAANTIIARMRSEGRGNIADFFEKVKEKAMDALDDDSESDNEQNNENTKIGDWWQNQYPAQANQAQANKATDRKQRIQTFNSNNHFQMNRERLGVPTTRPVPVAQGTINPNLRNITTRVVSIDSQYRQNILPFAGNNVSAPSFNTDYTLDLSDPLTNVISMKLYSVQIPTTWYAFDHVLGNTCFKLQSDGAGLPSFPNSVLRNPVDSVIDSSMVDCSCIPVGNYTNVELKDQLPTAFNYNTTVFEDPGAPPPGLAWSIEPQTQILEVANPSTHDISFIYYGPEMTTADCSSSCVGGSFVNQNLGWNLGFRREPDASGNVSVTIPAGIGAAPPVADIPGILKADVPMDACGPKYFILVVDDFNQNHLNKGLVNITDRPNKLSLPSYYSADLAFACPTSTPSTAAAATANATPIATKNAPRKLTQAQLYSINEIIANRATPKLRGAGPTTTDVLAVIPLRHIETVRQQHCPYVEFGGTLQANVREYFGPVNIERLRVQLMDDKGNLVNLHDHDWSFSLIIEQLYQY